MPRASEKAVPEKLGRQTPTAAVVLPYTTTHGQEAIDLYNTTGRTAQQWQQLLLYDILAENEDGLWVHTKFGYSVPRRNGKNEIAAMRELYGLQRGREHPAHSPPHDHQSCHVGAPVQPAGQGQDRIQIHSCLWPGRASG